MKDLQSSQQQRDLLQAIKELNDHVAKLKSCRSDKEVEAKWLTNRSVLPEKKGSKRIIEDTGRPIYNKNKKMIGAVLVIRDVTEKTKPEQGRLKSNRLESLGFLAGRIALKAVVARGYSNDPVMADHKKYGFKDVIVKPFEVQEFCAVLKKMIN